MIDFNTLKLAGKKVKFNSPSSKSFKSGGGSYEFTSEDEESLKNHIKSMVSNNFDDFGCEILKEEPRSFKKGIKRVVFREWTPYRVVNSIGETYWFNMNLSLIMTNGILRLTEDKDLWVINKERLWNAFGNVVSHELGHQYRLGERASGNNIMTQSTEGLWATRKWHENNLEYLKNIIKKGTCEP